VDVTNSARDDGSLNNGGGLNRDPVNNGRQDNGQLNNGPRQPELVISESLRFAYDTFSQ